MVQIEFLLTPHLASSSAELATAEKSLFMHLGVAESCLHDTSLPHISHSPVVDEQTFASSSVVIGVQESAVHYKTNSYGIEPNM